LRHMAVVIEEDDMDAPLNARPLEASAIQGEEATDQPEGKEGVGDGAADEMEVDVILDEVTLDTLDLAVEVEDVEESVVVLFELVVVVVVKELEVKVALATDTLDLRVVVEDDEEAVVALVEFEVVVTVEELKVEVVVAVAETGDPTAAVELLGAPDDEEVLAEEVLLVDTGMTEVVADFVTMAVDVEFDVCTLLVVVFTTAEVELVIFVEVEVALTIAELELDTVLGPRDGLT